MTDILDEAKEDLKHEKLMGMIRKYLPYVIIALVAIIIGIIIKTWWTSYKHDKIHADGSTYMLAISKMRAQNLKDALVHFEEIKDKTSNYSALANLNLASYAIFQKDFTTAFTILERVEKQSHYSDLFREYAIIQNTIIQLDNNKITPDQAIVVFEKHMHSENIFSYSVKELLVNLYIKQGNHEKAKELIGTIITDLRTPSTIRTRIEQISSLVKYT